MYEDLFSGHQSAVSVAVGDAPGESPWMLPWCDDRGRPLPLPALARATVRFLRQASRQPGQTFDLSSLTCWDGYPAAHVAPLFAAASANCRLPAAWQDLLKPWNGMAAKTVRIALVGRAGDSHTVAQGLSRLTARLDAARMALLLPEEGVLAEEARVWAGRRGIACYRFPAFWREVRVPHAEIRHGSVGKRYNLRAGRDRDARILANATHVIGFGAWPGEIRELVRALALPSRLVRS
ncbi:hypothetical protein MIN45_P1330 [Methylomarinovum tepidoasis]|uniref:Uncharacterized protein n=1 Tax=Methylomarinovum tepidoasis TaxID=2840183 RepID=A0AAU9CW84_9GAMM|nr:hypothetical protein [Methylomarinovum sp. IN45]BCX88960.1 hypothetical protein MIN45_P1330 [Methylomarinovum sp. IN45]